jgi:hypothetical protein
MPAFPAVVALPAFEPAAQVGAGDDTHGRTACGRRYASARHRIVAPPERTDRAPGEADAGLLAMREEILLRGAGEGAGARRAQAA